MIQDKNMNRKRSKTLVLPGIYYLICIVIAVQEIEMKEEEKQHSVVYAAAASPYLLTLQLLEIGDVLLIQ
jgi:hypothetical protein